MATKRLYTPRGVDDAHRPYKSIKVELITLSFYLAVGGALDGGLGGAL